MHVSVIAVGGRQPDWIDTAFAQYARRLPSLWQFNLQAVAAEKRTKSSKPDRLKQLEGERVLANLHRGERCVALDEGGRQFSTMALSARLEEWLADGRDMRFVIGGPDGLSAECLARADNLWSLSKLTLPHGLVRILLAEQLYRAWSIGQGHPYHRP